MIKTEFMELLEELDNLYEATDSVEAIIAEIEAGAKALLQDGPVTEAIDLDIDNNDIDALQVEADKDWKKSQPWIERVKTWFAEKVLKVILKNEKVYDALITNQFEGNRVESYLVDITYDLQQIHWKQLEEVAIKNAAETGVDTSNLALKVISKDNWYNQEKFFVQVLKLIRSGAVKDIYEAVRTLDLELFEYKLVSKELLESDCALNEGIEDVDFKALADAEAEAARLEKEIWDLEKDYNTRVNTAVFSDEQYKKFKAELAPLQDQLRELKRTYERRSWFRSGPDDYDHEDWVDEEAYAKVKDRVEELNVAIKTIEDKLAVAAADIKQQFEADKTTIDTKKSEKDQHRSTAKTIRGQLEQSYSDVEAEITEAAKTLEVLVDEDTMDGYIKSSIEPKLFYNARLAPDRMLASINFKITGEDSYLSYEDFDSDGMLLRSAIKAIEESAFVDAGWGPEAVAEYKGLEPSSDKGWYKIPNSEWELWTEYDVELVDAPSITYDRYDDYEIDEGFTVEANLLLGKKVTK